jgi:hypothetical protein
MVHHPKKYFEEVQHFDQLWLKLLMIAAFLVSVIPLYIITIKQFTTGVPAGNNPVSNESLIITDIIITLVVSIAVSLIFLLKLKTEITSEGIRVSFKPLVRNMLIRPGEIEHWEVRKYNPIKEYGGWGYRFGNRKHGTAYNVKGNMGLQLILKHNRKLLIGTQRPEAIKRAMEKLMMTENG